MFERFTERARQVVVLANEEARRLNHGYIGTEHFLLGLIAEEEGLAARTLADFGIDLEQAGAAVVRIVGVGDEPVTGRQIPFTPRMQTVLELSLREAASMQHNYVGTEHLLLALAGEGQGVANRIMAEYGATSDAVRKAILRRMAP